MPAPSANNQNAFRYRATDSASGVTRKTAKLPAQRLGVDETGVIYRALHQQVVKVLPQYEADDGPLSTALGPPDQETGAAKSQTGNGVGSVEFARDQACMRPQCWSEPTAGEIVCCHFPDNITPGPSRDPR